MSASTPTSTAPVRPAVRVVPSTGLHDRQLVRVEATGFTAGASLAVVECAQKGAATQAADCDVSGMVPVTADGAGRVSIAVAVRVGPFGGNEIRCSTTQPCLISVTQASLSPGEEADATITFAPGSG
jgi:hypothetical protein